MITLMDPLTVNWASVQLRAKKILHWDQFCVKHIVADEEGNYRRVRMRQFQLVESVIEARYGPLMRCYLPPDWLENACHPEPSE